MLTATIVRLETCCGSVVKRCIDAACKTYKDDACHADHDPARSLQWLLNVAIGLSFGLMNIAFTTSR